MRKHRGGTTLLRNAFLVLSLTVAIAAVFGQSLRHDFVRLDDDAYVYENTNVTGGISAGSVRWAFSSFHESNWHPLTWVSHMADIELFGLSPGGHHLVNVIFHLLNTILLFAVLRRMTGSLYRSCLAAALFGLHPLHVESVAWIAERKDVLSSFFWMLSLTAYASYVERPNVGRYLPLLLFFTLGLLAKPMVVTLPLVLLVLDFWPLGRLQKASVSSGRRGIMTSGRFAPLADKVPLLLLSAGSAAITVIAQKKGGSLRSLEHYDLPVRVSNALLSYARYVGKMIWPLDLSVFYPFQGSTVHAWKALPAALFFLGVSLLAILLSRRAPCLFTGWSWYVITLLPVIGIVQVGGQSMADRYTYLPLIGMFILLAWSAPGLGRITRRHRLSLAIPAVALLLLLSSLSWMQCSLWKDSVTLLEHAVASTSGNALAHNNLGTEFSQQGKTMQAIEHYRKALQADPLHIHAHYNLGNAYLKLGDYPSAIPAFKQSLVVDPGNIDAYNNLGLCYARQGEFATSISYFNQALEKDPFYALAFSNLGDVYRHMGDFGKAASFYSRAAALDPSLPPVREKLDSLERGPGRDRGKP